MYTEHAAECKLCSRTLDPVLSPDGELTENAAPAEQNATSVEQNVPFVGQNAAPMKQNAALVEESAAPIWSRMQPL